MPTKAKAARGSCLELEGTERVPQASTEVQQIQRRSCAMTESAEKTSESHPLSDRQTALNYPWSKIISVTGEIIYTLAIRDEPDAAY